MIKFGTNGWRAIMGEQFTFHNVRIVSQAIANHLKKRFSGKPICVIVNYDTRFLSERFALEAAKVLSHNKIQVCLSDRDAPSQAMALQIIKRGAQGGINFTASFNPPEYNGLKFSMETGAPALPMETDKIEDNIIALRNEYSFCPYYPRSEFIEKIDLQQDYLSSIQTKIDFDLIRRSKLKIAVDLLYGTSREYLDEILEENNIPVEEIHGYIDPYFGGIAPSCTKENLAELSSFVKEKKCHVGLATDADGDRFGIVSDTGQFIAPNLILSLLLDYLIKQKKWKGGVVRSVSTTHLIDRIARRFDLPLYKTRVGFKFIADLYLQGKIMFGGEESASLAVQDHLPEKDGIMAGLLVVEIIAATGKSLPALLRDLFKEYGRRDCLQKSLPLTQERDKKLRHLLDNPPDRIAGRKVINIETIDGLKLDFEDDDWILFRKSGTEPLVRWYAEAGRKTDLARLIRFGEELFA